MQFKIEECDDEVYGDSSSDEEEEEEAPMEGQESESGEEFLKKKDEGTVAKKEKKVKSAEFPKSFIFSCVGIGLTNIARKTE